MQSPRVDATIPTRDPCSVAVAAVRIAGTDIQADRPPPRLSRWLPVIRAGIQQERNGYPGASRGGDILATSELVSAR
jgi:hypothetical protein